MQDDELTKLIKIPISYRKEMLADWIGAGKAIRGDASNTEKWYQEHRDRIQVSTRDRCWIEEELRGRD